MSNVTSPRASTAAFHSPASSSPRSSVASDQPTAVPPAQSQRRNRAALRDYYGLKATTQASNATVDSSTSLSEETPAPVSEEPKSELDKPDFDAEAYIRDLLANGSLETVLKVETGLVSDIRGFDGERKALVYDNYSKLISATDTIKRMRTNMDPLAPITSTLEPAVARIADTADGLNESLKERIPNRGTPNNSSQDTTSTAVGAQRQTVKWVLDTPRRLAQLVQQGRKDDAQADWAEVSSLLDKWTGVKGVDEVRERAKSALAG